MAKQKSRLFYCYNNSYYYYCYYYYCYVVWMFLNVLQLPTLSVGGGEVKECSERITVYSRNRPEKTGTIRTIGYPTQHYSNNLRCIYYLVGEHNERVNLTFTDFDVNGVPPRCLHDYVDIYTQVRDLNQDLLSVPLHGRFCGKDKDNLPNRIISMTNILVVGFYTDENGDGKGFQLNYNFISDSPYRVGTPAAPNVCGFTVVSQRNGVLLSPTYPGMYPDNIFCFYKLLGVKGQRIRISFHDVDLYSGGKHCPFDYIKVYDGLTNEAEVIDTFCGTLDSEMPVYTLYSRSENLHIEFVTKSGRKTHLTQDESEERASQQRGFNATFEISDKFVNLDNITEGEHIPGTECDRRILSKANGLNLLTNGTVTSPYYPGEYPLNVICHYYIDGLIDAQNLEKVQLFIENVDISQAKQDGVCRMGYVRAYSRRQRWLELLETRDKLSPLPEADEEFCGKLNQTTARARRPIVTDNPRLVLVFNSVNATPGTGFKATYQFLTDYAIPGTPVNGDRRCHFLYLSTSSNHGTFNSPRHPSNYPAKTYCIYMFVGREDEIVRITFEHFKIEGADEPNCTKDYLQVFKVTMMNNTNKELASTQVAKYCGDRLPGPQEEDTNNLKVVLHSDEEGTRNGFRAKYEFIKRPAPDKRCFFNITSGGGGKIELPISPHTQHKYSTNTTCEWVIWGKSSQSHILLTFEEFHIEGNPQEKIGCGNAVLKIYAQKTHGIAMHELCGENKTLLNLKIISPSNFLRLKFISSGKATGAKGFYLPWTELLQKRNGKCNGFQCKINDYCISSSLKCDGVNNCGSNDKSDETTQCGLAYHQHGALPIILGVVAAAIVIIVIIVFIVHRRRKGKKTKKETIQVRFLTRSASDEQQAPGINGSGAGSGSGNGGLAGGTVVAGDSLLREKTEKVSIV